METETEKMISRIKDVIKKELCGVSCAVEIIAEGFEIRFRIK